MLLLMMPVRRDRPGNHNDELRQARLSGNIALGCDGSTVYLRNVG
jgi:hypothetical protein